MTAVVSTDRPSGTGDLKYLVYSSVATRPMSHTDLESILFTARRHNLQAGITGALLYRSNCFIQFLEGPPSEIDSLMESICVDDRHARVRVLVVERAVERSFADWRMGFGAPADTRPTGVEGVRDSFDDLTSSSDDAVVRQAAEDFSIWFKVKEGSRLS
ncbi:BLUF domain-containing protein [Dietzia aurantiaca]|uniref:BLUF domain-containing protein n=1 Tax=Dietzia aurantiaca TaxID=983873 RepID=UPI001E2D53F0|nr:BLUF domain-containing protein [Dietzia aurantiaca]MCD2262705.1 BLUF domain-containing protein [Dietzia aurantiaca]